ncbi:hypothetical protein HDU84_000033 [Entophlyctis sp. JEL0112]|nr:hypothetical protein HDU84_000033 [Entophlyctis sp. JEL0112]
MIRRLPAGPAPGAAAAAESAGDSDGRRETRLRELPDVHAPRPLAFHLVIESTPILSLKVSENGIEIPPTCVLHSPLFSWAYFKPNDSELYSDSYVIRVELWNEAGTELVKSHVNIPSDKPILAGNTFSSSMILYDQSGVLGLYFIFNDLSVRIHGTFRLKFYLYNMMAERGILNRGRTRVITSIMSSPFTIYSSKSFPGTVVPSGLITASKEFVYQAGKKALGK